MERWGEHYEVIFSNRVLLELTRKGSSKGGMVQYLARRLGIDAQHIYCVGDNQNDIPMLAVSAIPFAPANCAPEVKQWGARILGACEESCVAQIVDILDHIYA
ncbi:MAG: HAD family hydrolase [Flavonifractor plautii]